MIWPAPPTTGFQPPIPREPTDFFKDYQFPLKPRLLEIALGVVPAATTVFPWAGTQRALEHWPRATPILQELPSYVVNVSTAFERTLGADSLRPLITDLASGPAAL